MTITETTAAKAPRTIRESMKGYWPLAAFLVCVALILAAAFTISGIVRSEGEQALQTTVSMTDDDLRSVPPEQLNKLREQIFNYDDFGSGVPAVNERELERIDEAVLDTAGADGTRN